jgi:phosphonate transport system substrate-binding protein
VAAADAVREVKAGNLHVLALTTGAVPVAVNKGGVIPFAVPADDEGKFGFQVEILVRSDSPIKGSKDLKGKKIHLGSFSSLSSFETPLVLLWEKEQLPPGRDHGFAVTESKDAIRGIIWGDYEVVAVANDYLARRVEEEKEKATKEGKEYPKDAYRSIYKSDVTYPPFCFAHVHDLKPELAAKVREAFTSFRFEGTGLEAAYAKANQTRFVPVTSKENWKDVRDLDQRLRKMFELR